MEQHIASLVRYLERAVTTPVDKVTRKIRAQRVGWANVILSALFKVPVKLNPPIPKLVLFFFNWGNGGNTRHVYWCNWVSRDGLVQITSPERSPFVLMLKTINSPEFKMT